MPKLELTRYDDLTRGKKLPNVPSCENPDGLCWKGFDIFSQGQSGLRYVPARTPRACLRGKRNQEQPK